MNVNPETTQFRIFHHYPASVGQIHILAGFRMNNLRIAHIIRIIKKQNITFLLFLYAIR